MLMRLQHGNSDRLSAVSPLPSPREHLRAVGRGEGWGAVHLFTAVAGEHDPPPPTPPHHSLREWEEGRTRGATTLSSTISLSGKNHGAAPSPRLRVILAVRPHVGRRGEPVGHVVEGGDRRDVPDVAIREANAAQPLAVGVLDGPGLGRELDGEIEHRALALVEPGGAVVHHDLLAQQRIAREITYRGTMRRDAVVT